MKTLRSSSIVLFFGAAVTLSVVMAQSAPAAKSSVTNTTEVIPKSVFTIPTAGGVARDPFFPTRIIQGEVATTVQPTNSHPSSLGCLTLKGLSGVPSNPLAMINGRTMSRGEDAEINTTECGRLLVHCVDITTNSAIIEVGGERRELRLRSEF